MRKTSVVCPWVCPDGKTQVTCEYRMEGGRPIPIRVHTIVISTQHSEDISQEEIQRQLMEVSRVVSWCRLYYVYILITSFPLYFPSLIVHGE